MSSQERILVVDDNVEAVQVLAAGLELYGHEVRVAYDGEQALAVLREFPADVVILDLGMPKLGGIAAARRIRADYVHRNIWLIALTGRAQPADRWDTSMAGFDMHLAKPTSVEEINELIDQRQARNARLAAAIAARFQGPANLPPAR